jgi:hypothetical protein
VFCEGSFETSQLVDYCLGFSGKNKKTLRGVIDHAFSEVSDGQRFSREKESAKFVAAD